MKKLFIIFITISLSLLKFNLYAIEAPNNLIITTINKGDSTLGLSKQGDTLTVNYTGWIFSNQTDVKEYCNAKEKMFDSNIYEKFNHQKPFSFVIGKGNVIKGWDIGLINVAVKSKTCLIIPPEYAYGNRRIGNVIEPNSTLIFEVELLEINKKNWELH
tara:strand:- start:290 stop:766 length:477 start_codon:yes stop_codon:yes gene_type:complete